MTKYNHQNHPPLLPEKGPSRSLSGPNWRTERRLALVQPQGPDPGGSISAKPDFELLSQSRRDPLQ